MKPRQGLAAYVSGLVLLLSVPPCEAQLQPWVRHRTFDDFRQGTFGDGGVNIYTPARGGVEMIHRWDLNNDGYLDLAVGQSHNTTDNEDAFIYWGTDTGPRSIMPPIPELQPLGRFLHQVRQRERYLTRLPSNGGGRSIAVDLNGDGWKEIVYCNFIHNHDVHQDAFIYWGSPEAYADRKLTRLMTLSATDVAAADFNNDGFVDLCFANGGNELGGRFDYDNHRESYIYWNGPLGFAETRRTSIPTVSAAACAAGDVKGDGFPALAFVNNHPDERSVYIYWSGKDGFSEVRREVRRGATPIGVELADVNGDGRADLIVLEAKQARIFAGSKDGIATTALVELPTLGARVARAADLNKDGFPDLVFPNPGEAKFTYIYWGSAAGFKPDRRTELPSSYASDVALADFNGDQLVDVAIANERDANSYDVNSFIYWNDGGGFHPARRDDVQGLGPVSAIADDLNRDGKQDLVLVNRYSGGTAANETIPGAIVYWGNAAHYYSPASSNLLPTTGDCHAIADLDQDGFLDLMFPNGHIYYGSDKGYDIKRRADTKLSGYGVNVADLNRDGWLDLIMATAKKGQIFWGGPDGPKKENVAELPLTTRISQAASVADLNKDGSLDLVFPDVDSNRVDFYWGDGSGTYKEQQRTSMEVHSASIATVADSNNDGWLDLVFGGNYDVKDKGRHTQYAVLLLGGPDGYSLERSQRFPAFDCSEQVFADLNKDGHLDMVVSNYHGHTTRSLPTFIYWGDSSRTYHESRRSTLPGESVLRLTVLDLNQDGWLDITAFNHQKEGDHTAGANIYWGSSKGYSAENRHWIPAFGVHFGERHNLGNIYDRALEETYNSAALEVPAGMRPAELSWRARQPHGTTVEFQVRSAVSKASLTTANWRGEEAQEGRIKTVPAKLNIPAEHRWLQYRACLITPNGGSTPVLEEVTIMTTSK